MGKYIVCLNNSSPEQKYLFVQILRNIHIINKKRKIKIKKKCEKINKFEGIKKLFRIFRDCLQLKNYRKF